MSRQYEQHWCVQNTLLVTSYVVTWADWPVLCVSLWESSWCCSLLPSNRAAAVLFTDMKAPPEPALKFKQRYSGCVSPDVDIDVRARGVATIPSLLHYLAPSAPSLSILGGRCGATDGGIVGQGPGDGAAALWLSPRCETHPGLCSQLFFPSFLNKGNHCPQIQVLRVCACTENASC